MDKRHRSIMKATVGMKKERIYMGTSRRFIY
jgi:hypothetical protein